MPISLKAASGGGSAVGGSLVPFPLTTQIDITVDGVRYLRSGHIETDTNKFDNNFYANTRATIFESNITFGATFAQFLVGNSSSLVACYGSPAVKYRVSSDNGATWQAEQTFPCETGDSVVGMDYFTAGNLWVAATRGGRIYSSPDLSAWTLRYQHPQYDITQTRYTQIKAFSSVVVAVGMANSGGICTTSTNGTSYTARTLSPDVQLLSVASNGTTYVFGTRSVNPTNTQIMVSTDFVSFSPVTILASTPSVQNYVSYANGKFYSSPLSGVLFESTGGSSWTRLESLNLTNLNTTGFVEYFDGLYFFGGGVRSSDGVRWYSHPIYTTSGNQVSVTTLTKINNKYWLYGTSSSNFPILQEGNNYLFAGAPIALTNASGGVGSPITFVYYHKVKL